MAQQQPRHKVRIGVLVLPPTGCQLLDLASVDVFYIASRDYMTALGDAVTALGDEVPAPVLDMAPDVEINYVSTVPAGSLLPLTACVRIAVTHSIADADAAPGKFDIVHVPGPDPNATRTADVGAWLAAHAATDGVDILSVCTGIFVCGDAGLLAGRTASGPRGMQALIRQRFEGVNLVGDEYRWVRDGNFWSSGKASPPGWYCAWQADKAASQEDRRPARQTSMKA